MGLLRRPLWTAAASAACAAALVRRREDISENPSEPVGRGPGPLDGSPFKSVVLLLQGVRPERREYLEDLYDPIFQDVLTVQWVERKDLTFTDPRQVVLGREAIRHRGPETLEDQAVQLRRERLENVRPAFTCLLDDGRIFYQSACLPMMMKYLLLRNPTTVGLMTCHADFWFRPSALLGKSSTSGLRLDGIWQLADGLEYPPAIRTPQNVTGPYCLEGERQILDDRRWHWRANRDHDRVWSAVSRLRAEAGYDTVACIGWADAFYLPRSVWDRFLNISRRYFFHTVHEIAVPTTFRILHRYHDVPLQLETRCWGGCCKYEAGEKELRSHICGHKMDLRNESLRESWSAILREDVATLVGGGEGSLGGSGR